MKVEIKSRFDRSILFSIETETWRLALEAAVKAKVYLFGANLTGADLPGANLTRANLTGANLTGADLTGADLTGAVNLKAAVGLSKAIMEGEPLKHASPEESVANLDKVREIILDNAERLDMGRWHGGFEWETRTCAEEAVCGTTHCLAGWLQVCATDPKIRKMDTHLAGIVSAPVAAKMFFRAGDETLAWLKDRKYADEAKDYA